MSFKDKTGVAQAIGNNPGRMTALIENNLAQEDQDRLEAFLLPSVDDALLRTALLKVTDVLRRLQRPELTDVVAAIVALTPAEAVEAEPIVEEAPAEV